MAEEIDYMSDEFIKECLSGSADVRPGLLKTHREKRQQHILMKKIKCDKKEKIRSEGFKEVLEEGLNQPLNASNKGFSMLQKMGFKSGMGLGKNNEGMLEPIPITLKSNKKGLGHEVPPKRKKICKNIKNTNKLDDISEEDFRAFVSTKYKERELLKDFRKAQRICLELDLQANLSKPQETWFWPISAVQDEELEDVDDSCDNANESELSNKDKLEILIKYLRITYYYCLWCEIKYEDEKEMQSCPGIDKDSHSDI